MGNGLCPERISIELRLGPTHSVGLKHQLSKTGLHVSVYRWKVLGCHKRFFKNLRNLKRFSVKYNERTH